MERAQIIEKVKVLFKNHKLTIISTIDTENNKPESAVIGFAENEDLSLVFGTSKKSRKYKNIQANPNVSFVIGWSSETGSVQYEGIAKELQGDEIEKFSSLITIKNNLAQRSVIPAEQAYFLVTPIWMRLIDTNPETGGNYEISFS